MVKYREIKCTYVLCCLLVISFITSGCASTTRITKKETGEIRKVKIDTEYGFMVSEPTLKKPEITFKLVQIETYVNEKQMRRKEIKESKPGVLIGIGLIPLWAAVGIVTLGNVDVYDVATTEDVIHSAEYWTKENDKPKTINQITLRNVKVKLSYEYAGEENTIYLVTNETGEVNKDLRNIARSITLDPYSQEYIEFKIESARPYKCVNKIRIRQEYFIKTYKKWSDEGWYQSFFKIYINKIKRLLS